jgi:hypothetical protein
MERTGERFLVDTHPTKQVVVSSLTRDLSIEACIFDLIDNSIDAARDTIFHRLPQGAHKELPDSFAGFRIKLTLSGTAFKIEDNCGGIAVDRVKTMVLRFGQRSSHEMGIGIFGIGLNRALFKLGRLSHLKTDTGDQRTELSLNTEEYLNSPDWDLTAEEFQSNGKVGTEIEIVQLPADVARQFSDGDWVENLRRDIGRRYGRFIAKELSLSVNRKTIKNEEVRISRGRAL